MPVCLSLTHIHTHSLTHMHAVICHIITGSFPCVCFWTAWAVAWLTFLSQGHTSLWSPHTPNHERILSPHHRSSLSCPHPSTPCNGSWRLCPIWEDSNLTGELLVVGLPGGINSWIFALLFWHIALVLRSCNSGNKGTISISGPSRGLEHKCTQPPCSLIVTSCCWYHFLSSRESKGQRGMPAGSYRGPFTWE